LNFGLWKKFLRVRSSQNCSEGQCYKNLKLYRKGDMKLGKCTEFWSKRFVGGLIWHPINFELGKKWICWISSIYTLQMFGWIPE
jgi:hypothetical protein